MPVLCNHTDEQLFGLIKLNNEIAFTELYNRYWKSLLIRAYVLLKSHADAEDIVHDVFVQIWNKRASVTILKTFRSYIFAILQYDCFKKLADNRKQRFQNTNTEVTERPDFTTTELIDFDNLRDELEKVIIQLPEKCQLIFRLSRDHDLSDKEISEKLHISLNTVRTQKHRALVKLKKSIAHFLFV